MGTFFTLSGHPFHQHLTKSQQSDPGAPNVGFVDGIWDHSGDQIRHEFQVFLEKAESTILWEKHI